jgi:hypothetical protein
MDAHHLVTSSYGWLLIAYIKKFPKKHTVPWHAHDALLHASETLVHCITGSVKLQGGAFSK